MRDAQGGTIETIAKTREKRLHGTTTDRYRSAKLGGFSILALLEVQVLFSAWSRSRRGGATGPQGPARSTRLQYKTRACVSFSPFRLIVRGSRMPSDRQTGRHRIVHSHGQSARGANIGRYRGAVRASIDLFRISCESQLLACLHVTFGLYGM